MSVIHHVLTLNLLKMSFKSCLNLRKLTDVSYFIKTCGNRRSFLTSQRLQFRDDDRRGVVKRLNYESDTVGDIWKKEDLAQHQNRYKPNVETEKTSVLLFPGQGSQFLGMGKQLLRYPGVEDIYAEASEVLRYNILDVCLNGPQEKLHRTLFCQPAVFVTSLAATKKLVADYPEALDHVAALAGFSVGEITALVFGGVMSFFDGLQLVRLRGLAMQEASQAEPGGMVTVFLGSDSKLGAALETAKAFCRYKMNVPTPVCQVAIDLSINVKVIAGHEPALEFILKYGKEWNIKDVKPLQVSGAFHTQIMKNGQNSFRFRRMLSKIPLEKPSVAIWSGHDGSLYGSNANITRKKINLNMTNCIRWEQIMHRIYNNPGQTEFPNTYEVGPGKQLGWVIHKINRKGFDKYKNIEV